MRSLTLVDVNHNFISETESMINRIKEIDHKIKVLEAEKDKLKKSLINGYFSTEEEFESSEGLVLATYKSHKRAQFLTTEFKAFHPELYLKFSKDIEVKTFTIKK